MADTEFRVAGFDGSVDLTLTNADDPDEDGAVYTLEPEAALALGQALVRAAHATY